MAAGPLSVVALIAGWVTTEVGRQPWVVYGVMRTEEAVTGADGIPVGYATLAVVYAGLLVAVVWILRRLARAPLELPTEARPIRSAAELQSRCVLMLVGLTAYAVLGGADFGAGLLAALRRPRPRAAQRSRSTPTARWGRCGRPTTSG